LCEARLRAARTYYFCAIFSYMEQLLPLIDAYGYLILFPLAIIEGPIVTIIGGFFVTLGIMDPLLVFAIVIAGDVIGDSAYYGLGRWSGTAILARAGGFLGITEEKLEKAKSYFNLHGNKMITFSKLIHGIGTAGLVAAGSLAVPYRRYITICFLVTLAQSSLLLAIGILFGHAYVQIERYLNYYAAVASIAVLLVLLLLVFYRLKLSRS